MDRKILAKDRRMFIICIMIPIAIGFISYLLTKDAMNIFETMNKPPLAPPAWLFLPAWTILYILMGIGSFTVYKSKKDGRMQVLMVYAAQLFFNALWTPIFFLGKAYWFALAWLIIMLLMIVFMTFKSAKVSKIAMLCFVPYIVWCIYASYLNAGIATLN